MRSETAFRMLRSISIGTKLQDHHYVYRSDLPVPYPDRDAQEKIHQMVTKAYDKRYEAIALQDKAVQIIHDQVEGTA